MYVICDHFLQNGPICHLWNFTANFNTIIKSVKNTGANEKDPFMHMLMPQNVCLYKKKKYKDNLSTWELLQSWRY